MKRDDIMWESVDWSVSNARLAKIFGCDVKTVARYREKCGKPRRHTISIEQHEIMREGRKLALEQGKYDAEYHRKSREQTGVPHGNGDAISAAHLEYGEEHPAATSHSLIAPDGERFDFENIEHFVRDHADFFDPQDTEQRVKASGKKYCLASNGLHRVSSGQRRSWKGWTKA